MEKLAGLDMSIVVQMSLKTLPLLVTASEGVLFAWCNTESGGNSEFGDQV